MRHVLLVELCFFVAFSLINLLELLLDLFDSLAINGLELLLLLEIFAVLASEIFFFEFDLVVGVPNIVSLNNS